MARELVPETLKRLPRGKLPEKCKGNEKAWRAIVSTARLYNDALVLFLNRLADYYHSKFPRRNIEAQSVVRLCPSATSPYF